MKNILSVTKNDVTSAYSGRPGCMCGCKGKHSYHPKYRIASGQRRGYKVSDDEVSLRSISYTLNKLQRFAIAGGEVDYGDNYAYAEINGRAYAVYSA